MVENQTSRMDRHIARTSGDSDTAFLDNPGQLTYFLQLCTMLSTSLFQDTKRQHTRRCFLRPHSNRLQAPNS